MTSRTTTLPLFPLSLVLFPGMSLPLHIFEERYKRMIALCIREGRDFGVVLAGAPTDVPGQCLTYPVGTTAHITGVTRLPDGCMNLVTTGRQRFRIRSLDWDLAYCMAEVEWLPEEVGEAAALLRKARRRWDAFREEISRITGESLAGAELPDDPTEATYTLAATVPINTTEKQRLLEATDTATRLLEVIRLLAREHGLLRYLTTPHANAIAPTEDSEIVPN